MRARREDGGMLMIKLFVTQFSFVKFSEELLSISSLFYSEVRGNNFFRNLPNYKCNTPGGRHQN
jgi:hypothetical protein